MILLRIKDSVWYYEAGLDKAIRKWKQPATDCVI
jgi:hypothetical protein